MRRALPLPHPDGRVPYGAFLDRYRVALAGSKGWQSTVVESIARRLYARAGNLEEAYKLFGERARGPAEPMRLHTRLTVWLVCGRTRARACHILCACITDCVAFVWADAGTRMPAFMCVHGWVVFCLWVVFLFVCFVLVFFLRLFGGGRRGGGWRGCP